MTQLKKTASKKKKALGRTLNQIMGEDVSGHGHVEVIPAGKLRPGRFQPRQEIKPEEIEELASSIRQYGILQPLLVRPIDEQGDYEIIAGERRWRAAQRGQRYEIPVYILPLKEKEAYIAALTENLQREDLNPVEESEAFGKLINGFSLTQEAVASCVGKSRSYITNALRLLKLPENILMLLRQGKLSSGHGRVLLAVDNPQELAQLILRDNLTVREAEAISRKNNAQKTKKTTRSKKVPLTTDKIVPYLKQRCGVVATLEEHGEQGVLNIRYKDKKQLTKLLKLFKA